MFISYLLRGATLKVTDPFACISFAPSPSVSDVLEV